ncbi:extracellular solute-binding protein [Paenibacillus sp. B01]|uniref:extracellular solute-binding protein n=1 Tax=Paenibacillus sp. B01 TaxID=2660554 RepID=UPI00129A2290|nr:extracellular solute-binding protein [Paenibacillus sp. B01]QGG57356.1 extracellular solute-binding protein [Paenibacillus sp. B01]
MIWKLKAGAAALLVGTILLAGCSSNASNGNESGNSGAPANASGSNNETTAPVKLTWFSDVSGWNPPSPWNSDPNSVEGTITSKTGISFEFNIPAQDAGTKLSLMLVNGDKLPDVMSITDGTLIKKLIQADKVWNLDEFLKQYDPDSPLLANFPGDIKQALIDRDGGWYAYPSHMDSKDARELYPPSSEFYSDFAKFRGNGSIMFNEQIMQQAGIKADDLKTEDGVLAAFDKVKGMQFNGAPVIPLQIDGKGYAGINVGRNGHGGTLGVLEGMFGAMPVDKDGNYRDIILAPETKHAIDFLYKAAKQGAFDPSQMTTDGTATKAAVKSGRVFAFIGNTADTGFTDEDAVSTWTTPGPVLSNQNTKPVFGKSMKAGAGWMSTFISKSAPHPEQIAKWLDFMTSDEGLLLNYYGFEGKGYTLENGLAVQTEQGLKDAASYSTTGVMAFWPFHNIAWHDHATKEPTSAKGTDGLMARTVQTTIGKASEIYDTTPLQMPSDFIAAGSKMANDQLQIQTYLEAQVSKMVLAKDEASRDQIYNDTIAKAKQMGLDEINAKINEQFHKQEQSLGVTVKGINS